ncbi:MAG: hypothetical protein D6714_00525, partial [Bacteroidetes bacterium]
MRRCAEFGFFFGKKSGALAGAAASTAEEQGRFWRVVSSENRQWRQHFGAWRQFVKFAKTTESADIAAKFRKSEYLRGDLPECTFGRV